MLIMADLNEHSQCHLQVLAQVGVLARNIDVISYSGPALQVITYRHSLSSESPRGMSQSNEITACSMTILGVPLVFSS